jgi:hypothetical protein
MFLVVVVYARLATSCFDCVLAAASAFSGPMALIATSIRASDSSQRLGLVGCALFRGRIHSGDKDHTRMRRRVLAEVADDDPRTGIPRLKFVHDGTGCFMRVGIASSRTAFDK